MKKMVATTFLVIMLTMTALIGTAYLGANTYIDPVLKNLQETVESLQPEVRSKMMFPLTELEQLREMSGLMIPFFLFLAGLTMTLILSPLLRRFAVPAADKHKKPQKMEIRISQQKQAPTEIDSRPLVEAGACRIMALLQNRGRLIDFLEEDIAGYPDAQIGAAVRNIHEACKGALAEYMSLAPIMAEKEGETVVVSEGFDPSEIRLTGNISGKAPYKGTLQHPGWKVTGIKLPDQPRGQTHTVIAPAEVEID